ncbi:MAG: hypothetical protein QM765_20050 [Myxococcales bacterium]
MARQPAQAQVQGEVSHAIEVPLIELKCVARFVAVQGRRVRSVLLMRESDEAVERSEVGLCFRQVEQAHERRSVAGLAKREQLQLDEALEERVVDPFFEPQFLPVVACATLEQRRVAGSEDALGLFVKVLIWLRKVVHGPWGLSRVTFNKAARRY